MAHAEGERYGGTTDYPNAPGIPATQSVALFQSPEPRLDRRLSGPSPRPPLCTVDAGSGDPRPQKLRGPDARGTSGRPLSGSHADHPRRYRRLDRSVLPAAVGARDDGDTPACGAWRLRLLARSGCGGPVAHSAPASSDPGARGAPAPDGGG